MDSGPVATALLTRDAAQPLSPPEAARLASFARACRAAARAVVLYPEGHPAVASTLGRLVQVTAEEVLPAPLRIDVAADGLRLDGRAPARPDAALAELAALLRHHLIGQLTVHAGADAAAWKSFLDLLGRPPEEIRADGGIGRVWAAVAARHVELKEIDYGEVLRERSGRLPDGWDDVMASCLEGHASDLCERTLRVLLESAKDRERLSELLAALDARVERGRGGIGSRAAALMRLLQALVAAVQQLEPDALDSSMGTVSEAVSHLSPEMVLALLSSPEPGTGQPAALAGAIVDHMSDQAIAGFVARHALADQTATDRLAQAFHALVRDAEDKERLVALAHEEIARSPLGRAEQFEQAWDQVARQLLTSYSDEPFVSEDYARELSSARGRAQAVEHLSDDPPERLAAWRATVSTSELRRLDVTLLVDLLRVEHVADGRLSLARPAVSLMEDLLLLGDVESAAALFGAVRSPAGEARADAMAAQVTAGLVAGPMVTHIVAHLPSIDEAQFERVSALCTDVGGGLLGPLAEALAAEERTRPRQRLTAIFRRFGAEGRREVERLKASPNPAVRRAAVSLLAEFGGQDALPDLTELLRDSEPQVQREAVRAILNIGTERAYVVLGQALTQGTDRSRDSIMQSLSLVRDERAAPVFAHIVGHVDHRGPLRPIYLRAIESLGALRDPAGVPALEAALRRGEWWAPRRTAMIRGAAAAALVRMANTDADAVLDDAVRSGSRGVRAAVTRARGRRA